MEAVHRAALALGTANQLTNILRDVGEDAMQRNRIYVPRDELAAFNISEAEVGAGTAVLRILAAGQREWKLRVGADGSCCIMQ